MSSFPIFPQVLFQPEPSDSDKVWQDAFVLEYLKDFNEFQACVRVGFEPRAATMQAKVLMNSTYVQRRIQESLGEQPGENPVERDKALVLRTLRQCMYSGTDNAKVQAAKTMAQIHGFDRSEQTGASDEVVELLRAFALKQT